MQKANLAIQQRRDSLQHPYIVELANWASGTLQLLFASSFNKENVTALTQVQAGLTHRISRPDQLDLVVAYTNAFEKYREDFDAAIVDDMRYLGFPISEVHCMDIRSEVPGLNLPEPTLGMFVKEDDRGGTNLSQLFMSQGMFRALSLVIHLNIASLEKTGNLLLIDDIGEGLDYERSNKLIDVVIKRAKGSNLQLIMTSNDRFVMNRVPLEFWVLLQRTGGNVHAYTERNAAEFFKKFKFTGLSNFDFFASNSLH